MGKIIRQLQDLAMSLRMVPLKGTFQKMNRLVRDLGHKSDKEVHFEIVGEEKTKIPPPAFLVGDSAGRSTPCPP